MVLKFRGNFSAGKKTEIVDFIIDNMSVSSRVRQFAVDEDTETICTVIHDSKIGVGGYFTCELQCGELTYDGGRIVGWVRKKCGKVGVFENGRTKWLSGPSYVDADQEQPK